MRKLIKLLGIFLVAIGIFTIFGAIVGGKDTEDDISLPDGTADISSPLEQNPVIKVNDHLDSSDASEAENSKDKSVWHKSGMYKVGTDIPEGEYLVQASGSCYMQVATDSSGSLGSISTNDNFTDWRYITLLSGQYFTVTNGSFASVDDTDPITSDTGAYTSGMYKVGRDIDAGEFRIDAIGNCYIEVSEDSSGSLYSIINNDNISAGENRYITVIDGQYIQFNNATMTPVS